MSQSYRVLAMVVPEGVQHDPSSKTCLCDTCATWGDVSMVQVEHDPIEPAFCVCDQCCWLRAADGRELTERLLRTLADNDNARERAPTVKPPRMSSYSKLEPV